MEQEIISKFNEKPKTKTAWRAMYFGIATLFIPHFLEFLPPLSVR